MTGDPSDYPPFSPIDAATGAALNVIRQGASRRAVLCVDFPDGKVAPLFSALAQKLSTDRTFVEVRPTRPTFTGTPGERLASYMRPWLDTVEAGRWQIDAVFAICAGSSFAFSLARILSATGPTPAVVLFDPSTVRTCTLTKYFTDAVQSLAVHLAEDEIARENDVARKLEDKATADLGPLAAQLVRRYRGVVFQATQRAGVSPRLQVDLIQHFRSYLGYLSAASGGDLRDAPMRFDSVNSEGASNDLIHPTLVVDTPHADLFSDPTVWQFAVKAMCAC